MKYPINPEDISVFTPKELRIILLDIEQSLTWLRTQPRYRTWQQECELITLVNSINAHLKPKDLTNAYSNTDHRQQSKLKELWTKVRSMRRMSQAIK